MKLVKMHEHVIDLPDGDTKIEITAIGEGPLYVEDGGLIRSTREIEVEEVQTEYERLRDERIKKHKEDNNEPDRETET